ncbi:MAG: methyltransferase domain-containing protein [Mariniblastus sp.]|nr:methyltransferase domain-containing protein [Mariniblastus sp.]MDG2182433.1 methyltransferase domain-containing protein [Mariniblastus sp.]
MSAFSKIESAYEKFGADEPFYAVLTEEKYKRKQLDQELFFDTGKELLARQIQLIHDRGIHVPRGNALDFGCGVGRLTNAMAAYFDEVIGVDISSTMIGNANKLKRRSNCSFQVNKRPDLSVFDEDQFDFIYSDITIQHIPSPESESYIRDFFRVLAPGGLAIFLVPDGPVLRPNSLPARFDKFYREQVRPFHKRIRGKYEVQVHRISQPRVETIIEESGGNLISVESHPRWAERSKRYKPLYYWASKPAI